VPAYNFAGDSAFEKKLRKLLDEQDSELVLAGEGCYDLQNRHYNLPYTRTSGRGPAIRYIDPFLPIMNWVCGYDDRENVNVCLLDRYIISYEPHNFRGHLEEFPLTLEYGKKVDALRKRYQAFLWDVEFQDTLGATVEFVGEKPAQGDPIEYSVFRRRDSGRKAVVIVNNSASPVTAKVSTGWQSRLFAASPENPEPQTVDGRVQLPPRSAAVVIESD
jgi:hypothetical protein